MTVDVQWLKKAEALGDALAERRTACEAQSRMPQETVDDFHDAGLWRLLQPKRYGGAEAHPNTFMACQTAIAKRCPSSAWVYGVVGVHSWQLALFDERAQDEVWGDDTRVLISSSYAPTGQVERVEGGYRLTGTWKFSSGCEFCDWVFLGGFVPAAEGAPPGPPDMRTFLLPKSDYRIDRTWNVAGLQGTGSHNIVVDGAFVPEHRTHKMSDGFNLKSPGNSVNTAPLFKVPFGLLFTRSVSTTAIGLLEGALDAYLKVARSKVSASDQRRVVEDPKSQEVCAEARAELESVKLVLERTFNELMQAAERGERPTIERRALFRYESAMAVQRCMEQVDKLMSQSGGTAIFADAPIQPFFQGIHAARGHYANNPAKPAQNLGRVLLELKTQDFFL
ncbi:MAG: acyl-CoA dehydrogenase family protein [Myxococcota bacterium]|nr:acyl-CoA dehydrogenase family protein [Myxococcota bacterium]